MWICGAFGACKKGPAAVRWAVLWIDFLEITQSVNHGVTEHFMESSSWDCFDGHWFQHVEMARISPTEDSEWLFIVRCSPYEREWSLSQTK
jgi:hypothetical protein